MQIYKYNDKSKIENCQSTISLILTVFRALKQEG